MGRGALGAPEHQFCGDAIVTLLSEVDRLRAEYAFAMQVEIGAVPLSPAVLALKVRDAAGNPNPAGSGSDS